MSRRFAMGLQTFFLIALFVGTQMPGAWRGEIEQDLHGPFGFSSWVHFVLFACMALVSLVRPLTWPALRVLLLALALALLTEGLQFFAIDRHPRWIDVGIDMAGAFFALALIYFTSFITASNEQNS